MTLHVLAAPVLVVALTGPAGARIARPVTGPSGHWEGVIQVPGQELKIEVDLSAAGENWEGTISIPVQGLKGFPLSAIAVKGDAVTFAMKNVPGDPQFTGTLSKDAKGLSGGSRLRRSSKPVRI